MNDRACDPHEHSHAAVVYVPPDPSVYMHIVEENMFKLLKALHVASRYGALKGKLPADVDYFGKSILGLTSIHGFGDTLMHSMRNVGIYLDVSRYGHDDGVDVIW